MTKDKDSPLGSAMQIACKSNFGVLDQGFLCQSVSMLAPRAPRTVLESASVADVIKILKEYKIGCIIVVNDQGNLTGIFSERDCVLKVFNSAIDLENTPIRDLMTKNPVTEGPTTTIAYALNLMSDGGFRHLPLVDTDGMPVGMISVKDIVDFLVRTFVDDLLNFEATLGV